ncbi:hypothetical protein [Bradyrhizobium oligotrophicum]|uniref:hypothetical protein n=1 Tax=Bradyrhizobium oligotrophicum TaxID=44255 RepID=UPI001181B38D|nr:hypothetical protein [Bradyrhizobium oligotrophicum]
MSAEAQRAKAEATPGIARGVSETPDIAALIRATTYEIGPDRKPHAEMAATDPITKEEFEAIVEQMLVANSNENGNDDNRKFNPPPRCNGSHRIDEPIAGLEDTDLRSWEMSETYKTLTDANGRYFDWLEELWAMEAERSARDGDTQESLMQPVSELQLPRLSFLVACLEAIRGNPDLMSKIADMARLHPTPDQLPQDESYELAHLVRMFLTWFELKRSGQTRYTPSPMNPTASGALYGILYDQERGHLRCSDAEAIRQEVLPGLFVDDLSR